MDKKTKYQTVEENRKMISQKNLAYYHRNKEAIAARRKLEKANPDREVRKYDIGEYSMTIMTLDEYQAFIIPIIMSGMTYTIIKKLEKKDIFAKNIVRYLPSYDRRNTKITPECKQEYKELKKKVKDTDILIIRRLDGLGED